ncbi:hypothetical protein T492DRAFT_525781 [Pavlovales sp. CCMP2436]|nr:hypothetical protein T492DRAFT_525781 [Pavlovales sp. CCMP2436]
MGESHDAARQREAVRASSPHDAHAGEPKSPNGVSAPPLPGESAEVLSRALLLSLRASRTGATSRVGSCCCCATQTFQVPRASARTTAASRSFGQVSRASRSGCRPPASSPSDSTLASACARRTRARFCATTTSTPTGSRRCTPSATKSSTRRRPTCCVASGTRAPTPCSARCCAGGIE